MPSGADTRTSPEAQPAPGVVELREDVPLKSSGVSGDGFGGGLRCCGGGPRFILACFAALTAAITLALLTQIYYGDYELVPHGSVSSSAAECSRAGTDALKAGGGALDAAAVAALCLAVVAPHRTSLDASGALLYWDYRQSRTQTPTLYEWGASSVSGASEAPPPATRPPRLVAALATLHARLGVLPWSTLLQPAIDLAKVGSVVTEGLSAAAGARGEILAPGSIRTDQPLAAYLQALQQNTSAELSAAWSGMSDVRVGAAVLGSGKSGWRMWTGGAGGAVTTTALNAALDPPPADPDEAELRVVNALNGMKDAMAAWSPSGVGSGLAVVDRRDTYIALVTGLSMPFGSGAVPAAVTIPGVVPAMSTAWQPDQPTGPIDLAPAFLLERNVCGTRYVLGAESSAALVQAAAALATAGSAAAVERARLAFLPAAALELTRPLPPPTVLAAVTAPPLNATPPYAAVNLVQQRADALLSHADSRGGGLASRF